MNFYVGCRLLAGAQRLVSSYMGNDLSKEVQMLANSLDLDEIFIKESVSKVIEGDYSYKSWICYYIDSEELYLFKRRYRLLCLKLVNKIKLLLRLNNTKLYSTHEHSIKVRLLIRFETKYHKFDIDLIIFKDQYNYIKPPCYVVSRVNSFYNQVIRWSDFNHLNLVTGKRSINCSDSITS